MPSDLASESSIIRNGSDGRLRYSPTQRQDLLDAFVRSGLSAMSFSRQHGVHYQTFIAWLSKGSLANLKVSSLGKSGEGVSFLTAQHWHEPRIGNPR